MTDQRTRLSWGAAAARRRHPLWWVAGTLFVLAGCASETSDPSAATAPTPTAPAEPTEPGENDPGALAERFGTVAVELAGTMGDVVELCLLLADTGAERAQGLMDLDDLEGHDGMLFAADEPTDGAFYMYRTLLPLTIGWFDDAGGFVSAADMEPCEHDDPAACERYPPAGPWRWAIEVVQGSPVADRFEPGAVLDVTGEACAAPA